LRAEIGFCINNGEIDKSERIPEKPINKNKKFYINDENDVFKM